MPSFRSDMVHAAARAPRLLDEAFGVLHDFLWAQVNPDGGFRDRKSKSSLYYTMCGLQALAALKAELPTHAVLKFLAAAGPAEHLDFTDLTCLVGCYTLLGPGKTPPSVRDAILIRLKNFLAADGAFHPTPGAAAGSMSGNFLGLGTLDDLDAPADTVVNLTALTRSVDALRNTDGSYGQEKELPLGNTASTAAALLLRRRLGRPVTKATVDWLKARAHPAGGFFATPRAALRDLVSTALALHSLSRVGVDLAPYKEPTLDFLDSLWSSKGGFHGHWGDDALDCERTFYALLALGHVAG